MIKRIFCFSLMFFLIIALGLYFTGVRSIDFSKSADWIRAVSGKLSLMERIKIPEIPTWNFEWSIEPAWYEYVQYYLSFIVNAIITVLNTTAGVINFVAGICKFMASIIWVLIESPSIYLT